MMSTIERKARLSAGTKCGTALARSATDTEALRAELPRGVTLGQWSDGRKKAWYVRHGSNPRKFSSFDSEGERNEFAQALTEELAAQADKLQSFSLSGWDEFQRFRARTGFAPLDQLEAVWGERRGSLHLGKTVEEAVSEFLRLRSREGLAADSVRHTNTILRRFSDAHGHRTMTSVTPDHIRDWLQALEKRFQFESVTLRHHRKDVNTFFSRALKEGWALRNPCEAVIPPKLAPCDDVPTFDVKQTFDFFAANLGKSEIIACLGFEFFAGGRCSSAARLAAKDIRWEEKGIVLPGSQHKTTKRFYVTGFPDNLWAWLDLGRNDTDAFGWNNSTYNLYKQQAFLRAGVENPGNVARHTFCTCHVAAFRNVGLTGVLLTHRNPAMAYQHYLGRGISEARARAYFAITPEAVAAGWAKFLEAHPELAN